MVCFHIWLSFHTFLSCSLPPSTDHPVSLSLWCPVMLEKKEDKVVSIFYSLCHCAVWTLIFSFPRSPHSHTSSSMHLCSFEFYYGKNVIMAYFHATYTTPRFAWKHVKLDSAQKNVGANLLSYSHEDCVYIFWCVFGQIIMVFFNAYVTNLYTLKIQGDVNRLISNWFIK